MATATHPRPKRHNDVPHGSTGRPDVFYELLITLTEDGRFALDAKAIEAFRKVMKLTVEDYLVNVMDETHKDLWEDKRFQKWVKLHMKKIARLARAKGGDRPSVHVIVEASNEVIRTAHDDYCASLPQTAVVPITRGPMCTGYIALLNDSAGASVG